jgi:hypothetical protein
MPPRGLIRSYPPREEDTAAVVASGWADFYELSLQSQQLLRAAGIPAFRDGRLNGWELTVAKRDYARAREILASLPAFEPYLHPRPLPARKTTGPR